MKFICAQKIGAGIIHNDFIFLIDKLVRVMVQVIQVFRPKAGSAQVDKSQPFSYTNMIPCEHDSPALIPKQSAILKDHEVVFLITRSKNDNTVVYRYSNLNKRLFNFLGRKQAAGS